MIVTGSIKKFWNIEKIKELPFKKEPVPNFDSWKEAKFYPAEMVTDSQCSDKTAEELMLDWEWTKQFHISEWEMTAVCVYKLSQGKVTPWHTDHFINFRNFYKIPNDRLILRRMIFLEDWQPGQLFAIDRITHTDWSAGDWIEWTQEHYHMGANLSNEIRYTVQLTGVKY